MNNLTRGILMILLGAIVPVVMIVMNVQFNQQCGGYLKQAADANTVELASERIGRAVEYIERNGLTDGYTSVLWRTENENVGFWYTNIKACQQELQQASGKSQLEQTNVLMKVRESLTDNGENGTSLTVPDGISRYPNNALYGILFWISVVLVVIGAICLLVAFEEL